MGTNMSVGQLAGGVAALIICNVVTSVVKNKIKNPEKSWFLALLNVALTPVRFFQLSHYCHGEIITMENGMKVATKETGLTDFGDLSFIESYSKIIKLPFYKQLRFTNVGYITAAKENELTLVRRLKMVKFIKAVPAVKDVPLNNPVFVFGLGRSGTTFVHRLLSLDPEVRSPKLWELVLPVPDVEATESAMAMEKDRERRHQFIVDRIKERNFMGDSALENLHEIGADLPEECLMALSDEVPLSFHYLYTVLTNLTTAFKEIPSERMVQAYASYKQYLQVLSYQVGQSKDPKRWVMKCPVHVFYLKELAKVFPDAKIVWAHRHPVPTVSSMCTLVKAMHSVYYEKDCGLNNAELGRRICDTMAAATKQASDDIATTGLPCAHVAYDKLVSSPLDTVKAIYATFGWTVSPEYEQKINEYMIENNAKRAAIKAKQQKEKKEPSANSSSGDNKMPKKGSVTGLHAHKPETYSLTEAELVSGNFATYIKKYKLENAF